MTEEQFQADIQRALGKSFQKIIQTQRIDTKSEQYLFRVTAVGESPQGPLQWNYYLLANPDGRQVVFAFTLEPKVAEAFQTRDLSILGSVEFTAPVKKSTQPASGGK